MDGDISLSLSAEIVDPDSGVSSVIEGSVIAVVDAAADRPEMVQADAPSEVGLGTDVSFDVQAQFGDWSDSSEEHFLLVELPDGWSDPSGAYETESFAAGNAKSEEHTSELQSLMRISYAVFCLKKTKKI